MVVESNGILEDDAAVPEAPYHLFSLTRALCKGTLRSRGENLELQRKGVVALITESILQTVSFWQQNLKQLPTEIMPLSMWCISDRHAEIKWSRISNPCLFWMKNLIHGLLLAAHKHPSKWLQAFKSTLTLIKKGRCNV
jgi:hypothetical protein